jgi:hypothetical protein
MENKNSFDLLLGSLYQNTIPIIPDNNVKKPE